MILLQDIISPLGKGVLISGAFKKEWELNACVRVCERECVNYFEKVCMSARVGCVCVSKRTIVRV